MKTIRYKKLNGRIQFPDELEKGFKFLLEDSKDGEHLISFGKPKRSIDQNSLMFMWFRCLSEDTKSEVMDFYQYYCEKFLGERCTYKDGKFSGGTSTLSTDKFTTFLNKIQADAASEFRVILPIPEDIYWEEFYNQFK